MGQISVNIIDNIMVGGLGGKYDNIQDEVLGKTSLAAASLLNTRVEVAQVGVSIDGKMLITTFLPLKPSKLTLSRLEFNKLNAGATLPTAGNSPDVLTGLPRNKTCAMMIFL